MLKLINELPSGTVLRGFTFSIVGIKLSSGLWNKLVEVSVKGYSQPDTKT